MGPLVVRRGKVELVACNPVEIKRNISLSSSLVNRSSEAGFTVTRLSMEADKGCVEEKLVASHDRATHNQSLLVALSMKSNLGISHIRICIVSDKELASAHIDLFRFEVN